MKTRISSLFIAFFIVFSLSNTNAFAQKKVELQYNLNVGDTYKFISDISQDVSFEASGSTMTLEQVMTFKMTSKVKSIDGNVIDKEITFDAIKMNQKIFGMEINYDSEDSATWTGMGKEIANQMNTLVGKAVEIIMDNKGNIQQLDLGEIMDNDDLSNSLTSGNTYAVYPEGSIKVGDSWESDVNPLKDDDMNVHMKYTLLKANRKQAVIGLEGALSGNEIQGELVNLSGTTVGEMTVDIKTGMLITSKLDVDLSLEMEQNGTKFPADITSTTVTTAVKVN